MAFGGTGARVVVCAGAIRSDQYSSALVLDRHMFDSSETGYGIVQGSFLEELVASAGQYDERWRAKAGGPKF